MFLAAAGMEAQRFAQPRRNQSRCVCVVCGSARNSRRELRQFFFVPNLCDSDSHARRLTDGSSCVFWFTSGSSGRRPYLFRVQLPLRHRQRDTTYRQLESNVRRGVIL